MNQNESEVEGMAPMDLMSEFLTLVSVENLTEQNARRALAISSTILRYEPKNTIIREYQRTLNQFIEHQRYEAKMADSDDDEDDEDGEDEEEDDEEDDDENSSDND